MKMHHRTADGDTMDCEFTEAEAEADAGTHRRSSAAMVFSVRICWQGTIMRGRSSRSAKGLAKCSS